MTDEVSYAQIRANRPRHIVFTDEAIGKLIRVAKLTSFHIDSPEGQQPMVTVVLKDPNWQEPLDPPADAVELAGADYEGRDWRTSQYRTYKGTGPTLGHALREMLDRVNVDFMLGEEDGEEGS